MTLSWSWPHFIFDYVINKVPATNLNPRRHECSVCVFECSVEAGRTQFKVTENTLICWLVEKYPRGRGILTLLRYYDRPLGC